MVNCAALAWLLPPFTLRCQSETAVTEQDTRGLHSAVVQEEEQTQGEEGARPDMAWNRDRRHRRRGCGRRRDMRNTTC